MSSQGRIQDMKKQGRRGFGILFVNLVQFMGIGQKRGHVTLRPPPSVSAPVWFRPKYKNKTRIYNKDNNIFKRHFVSCVMITIPYVFYFWQYHVYDIAILAGIQENNVMYEPPDE